MTNHINEHHSPFFPFQMFFFFSYSSFHHEDNWIIFLLYDIVSIVTLLFPYLKVFKDTVLGVIYPKCSF